MLSKIVYLAGFMATGKSTIGPILANTLGWSFYDLDDLIGKKYDTSIKKLINEKGESDFRIIESKVLADLNPANNTIVSLGGGTMLNQSNIDLMKKRGLIVLFESPENEIYHRMKNKKSRPLILTPEGDILNEKDLRNKIIELLKSRVKFYEQADIKINTAYDRVGITVDKLIKILKKEYLNA